jgi:quercetin dioxygenase-like cupin family protein
VSDDLGGEPACWSHLMDDLDTREADPPGRPPPVTVDLTRVDTDGSGAIWSLPHGGDLDANLVHLRPHEEVGDHVNDQVDVLVVVWDGSGELTVDGRGIPIRRGTTVLIPRGSRRAVRAGADGATYLTVHRRRDRLTIGPRP